MMHFFLHYCRVIMDGGGILRHRLARFLLAEVSRAGCFYLLLEMGGQNFRCLQRQSIKSFFHVTYDSYELINLVVGRILEDLRV